MRQLIGKLFLFVLLAAPPGATLVSVAQATMLDPTAPPGQSAGTRTTVSKPAKPDLSQLTLQQVLYREQASQVVINNELLSVGDTVQGFRIRQIEPRRVSVEKSGRRYWLTLYAGQIKKQ